MEHKSEATPSGTFTQITKKITSRVRENSLYYFVRDSRCTLNCLNQYNIEVSHTEDRDVLYVHPHPLIQEPTAFQNIQASNPHLSIDRLFSLENVKNAEGFSPAHYTVSYGDFRLHVYFNEKGKRLNHHVKKDSDGTYVTLADAENVQIIQQVEPIQKLLNTLIQEKNQTYLDLQAALFAAEEKLSIITNKAEYIQKGHEYLRQLETFNRYSDSVETQHSMHIERRIAYFEQPILETQTNSITEHASTLEASTAVAKSDSKASEITPASQTQTRLETLKNSLSNKIDLLIAEHRREANFATLIPLLQGIDALKLEITFEHDKDNAKKTDAFLKKQQARLPITLETIKEEFKTKLSLGDIAYIQENHALLSGLINMHGIFYDFINQISRAHTDIKQHERQLQMADYLYQHSNIYRSIISVRGYMLMGFDEGKLAYGLLLDCFLHNNFAAFQMFLQQGIPIDSEQLLFNGQYANALQALTLHYSKNPDLRFIQTLLDEGASLTQKQLDTVVEGESLEAFKKHLKNPKKKKDNKKSTLKLKADRLTSSDQAMLQAIKQNHTLKMAITAYASQYPELIEIFTKYTDAFTLFEIFGELVSDKLITTRTLVDPTGIHELQFIFFMNPSNKSSDRETTFGRSIAYVFEAAQKALYALPASQQRDIFISLIEHAERQTDTKKAYDLLKSAQIVYSELKHKTEDDDEKMRNCFFKMSRIMQTSHPALSETLKRVALNFMHSLQAKKAIKAATVIEEASLEAPSISIFDANKKTQSDATKTEVSATIKDAYSATI